MPTTVSVHQLSDLAHGSSKNEILLEATLNTELHIIVKDGETVIKFPFGNKFDIIDNCIIIHDI